MSAHNFWNNFSHGFMHGMFNSNPFFGCFGGGMWGNPFMQNSCFMPFGFNFFQPNNLFMYPSMNFSVFPMMQDFTMPTFNFTNIMPQNNIWDNYSNQNSLNWNFGDLFTPTINKEEKATTNTAPSETNVLMNNTLTSQAKPEAEGIKTTVRTTSTTTPANLNPSKHVIKTKSTTVSNKRSLNNSSTPHYNVETSSFNYDAKELKNKWAKKKPRLKLSQEFFNKVVQIAKRVECDPNDLMGVIDIETIGTFRPDITNPKTGATGLIQFMPKYVSSYGTSIEALKKMTAEEQLTYVEQYLVKNKQRYGVKGKLNAANLYTLILTPAYVKKDVLAVKGSRIYEQNSLLDKDKDGKITKSDLAAHVRAHSA